MLHTDDPVLVRRTPSGYSSEPGAHSHNQRRRGQGGSGSRSIFLKVALALLVVLGLGGVGYYAYTLSDQYIYQAYENWAFDQQIAGLQGVTFTDYLRERTPFGFVMAKKTAPAPTPNPVVPKPSLGPPALAEGALLGRVEISRLGVSAIVREGVGARTLSTAVGHIPSTSLPGQDGNFAIAAHRDTLFRALKDIRTDDLVTFQSAAGSYTYRVAATKIVKPSDVSVLRSDGGGLLPAKAGPEGADKLLTMITCYPFYYVGSAPKRFIVEARLVGAGPSATASMSTVQVSLPAEKPHGIQTGLSQAPRAVRNGSDSRQFQAWPRSTPRRAKKHGFWRRVLRIP
jgi:sortase A